MRGELEARLAALSPAKRALLERRLASTSQPQEFDISLNQQGVWFLDRLVSRSPLYTLGWRVQLRGELDESVLRRAIQHITTRHDALRTAFASIDGVAKQILHPSVSVDVLKHDLRTDPNSVYRVCRESYGRGFDVTQPPLIRFEIMRVAENEYTLLILVHHLVFDAVSFDVLMIDLAQCYTKLLAGMDPMLPAPTMQYRDFARWQRRSVQGERLRGLLEFWVPALEGAPAVINLPTDRPRPAVASYAGDEFQFRLPSSLSKRMAMFARAERATTFMTLLATLNVLLFRYSGQDNICIGTPVSGRTRPEMQQTLGYFINTVVLRTDLSSRPTFRQYLHDVRRMCLAAFDHQDLPFDRLVQELRPDRSLSHNPLFQVLFLSHYKQQPNGGMTDIEVTEVEPLLGLGYSRFDLSFITYEDDTGVDVHVEYSTDLFDRATIERLASHFEIVLEHALAEPDRSIDRIDISQADSSALPSTINVTPEVNLPQLFEAQVARSPDSVAVRGDDQTLTYSELDHRANILAGRLIASGAGPDRVVAVGYPRSTDLVVALMAVVKAGAAFLPVNVDHPVERIAWMLEDARPVVAIGCTLRGVPSLGHEVSQNTRPAVHVDNAAYVMFTSGSTGRPKGVVVSHRSIVNRLLWAQETFGLTPHDRILQKTPVPFGCDNDDCCTSNKG